MNTKHPNHKTEIPRLNRARGQLDGIKKMIQEQRECSDILIQLKAVRSAILSVEKNILSVHLEKCIAESFGEKNNAKEKINEIKDLFNKLQN